MNTSPGEWLEKKNIRHYRINDGRCRPILLHCVVEFYNCVVICLKTTHGTLLSVVINISLLFYRYSVILSKLLNKFLYEWLIIMFLHKAICREKFRNDIQMCKNLNYRVKSIALKKYWLLNCKFFSVLFNKYSVYNSNCKLNFEMISYYETEILYLFLND